MSAFNFTYKVATIKFTLTINSNLSFWDKLMLHYQPFICKEDDIDFHLKVNYGNFPGINGNEIFEEKSKGKGFYAFKIYDIEENYLFVLNFEKRNEPDGCLIISKDFKIADLILSPLGYNDNIWLKESTFTIGVMICFILNGIKKNVLLGHSSTIIKDKAGFMFIGKSGTGKSTHTRLWLSLFKDCWILNDDHPAVLVNKTPIVYGTPWSGKEDYYNNQSFPLKGLVRIKQAKENNITLLSPFEAYASISTSFSGFVFTQELLEEKLNLLEQLAKAVKCYRLECLPNVEAAHICYKKISTTIL